LYILIGLNGVVSSALGYLKDPEVNTLAESSWWAGAVTTIAWVISKKCVHLEQN
jgi:hypothetical protein